MTLPSSTRFRRPAVVGAGIAALVLLAYGDGSSAGIEGSGRTSFAISSGRITAFGSIFVNGVEYELSRARIMIDGQPAKASQLEVGQVVTVQASMSGPASGKAIRVSYTGDVVGPVARVDLARSELTVLGQTVRVDAATLFGDGLASSGLKTLAAGTNIEVSAFVTAAGDLLASRVDLQLPGAPLQVRGAIEGLNSTAKSFHINDLTIDYSQAAVEGRLANANTATVWADEYPSAGVLHATRVRLSSGLGGADGEQGLLEGLVTSVSSGSAFEVGDQRVVADSSTHVELHGQALTPNLAVRIEGVFDGAGVLVAKSVVAIPPTH